MSVIVCGPTNVVEVNRTEQGERWCFACRKRVPFDLVIRRDNVPEDYYGPWPSMECPSGHVDGDLFPGREREWEW